MNMVNMIKFQLKLICKTPVMFMSFFIYPVLLTAIIGYLAQGSFGGDVSSYEYYSIGMMIFIFLSSGLISSYNFLDDKVKGGNIRTMFSPINKLGIFLSQIISGTIYASVASGVTMIIFNLLFGINYNGNSVLIFISFIFLNLMANALGMFLCTIVSNIGAVNVILNIIPMILCVLGGTFFPLEALGEIPARISKISPVKWFMDGILNSMYDNNNFILFIAIVINIVVAACLILITSKTFKREKYL